MISADPPYRSGCKVIATASPRNFSLLKSLGAEEVFDYNDPECAKKIRDYTNDDLTLVLDCIAEGNSPKICEEAISSKGGEISYLLFAKHSRTDVKNKHTLGYTVRVCTVALVVRSSDGAVPTSSLYPASAIRHSRACRNRPKCIVNIPRACLNVCGNQTIE